MLRALNIKIRHAVVFPYIISLQTRDTSMYIYIIYTINLTNIRWKTITDKRDARKYNNIIVYAILIINYCLEVGVDEKPDIFGIS